jgi:hypothetical protein
MIRETLNLEEQLTLSGRSHPSLDDRQSRSRVEMQPGSTARL